MNKEIIKSVENYCCETFEDGTLVFVNNESGIVHVLNQSGALVYKFCVQRTLIDAREKFLNSFTFENDNERQLASCDFEKMVEEMIDKGLLQYESYECKQ